MSPFELTDGREGVGGVGRGSKSFERDEAWPSINHSIFSGFNPSQGSLARKKTFKNVNALSKVILKVPKCENFHNMDFFFYTIKPLWVENLTLGHL